MKNHLILQELDGNLLEREDLPSLILEVYCLNNAELIVSLLFNSFYL